MTLSREGATEEIQDRSAAVITKSYFLEHPKGDGTDLSQENIKSLLKEIAADGDGAEGSACGLLYELPRAKVTASVVVGLLTAITDSKNPEVRVAIMSALNDRDSNLAFRPESAKFQKAVSDAQNDGHPWIKRKAKELKKQR